MSEFASVREIKKTRKNHHCLGCGKLIPVGNSAFYFAVKDDGQFFDAYYHNDCRKAEIALNELHDTWGDEYSPLYMIRDGDEHEDDIAWLVENYPDVARRVGL